MRSDSNNIADAYKRYTMEELNDKIKEDELKGTFQIKKKFNPDEVQYLEEKIRGVDKSFFDDRRTGKDQEDSFSNNNSNNKQKKQLDVPGISKNMTSTRLGNNNRLGVIEEEPVKSKSNSNIDTSKENW
jgi:hypothetical protein